MAGTVTHYRQGEKERQLETDRRTERGRGERERERVWEGRVKERNNRERGRERRGDMGEEGNSFIKRVKTAVVSEVAV